MQVLVLLLYMRKLSCLLIGVIFNVISCRNVHSRSAGRHAIEMLREHGTSNTSDIKIIINK